jgi:hypothetical protein
VTEPERAGNRWWEWNVVEFENAVRRVFVMDMVLHGSPEVVFPLLCPVREYEWIPHWDCTMIYSSTGVAERGCIFITHTDRGDETWTVSRYEPPRAIEFVRVVPGVQVICMDLALTPGDDHPTSGGPGTTVARVVYTVTALNPERAGELAAMTGEQHDAWTRPLETLINHYLATGRMPSEVEPADRRP